MRTLVLSLALAAAMTVLANPAHSQMPTNAQVEARFKAADKDGDGHLTRQEAEAGMPRVAKNFALIDKTGKGFVTLDEIKQALAEHAQ